MSKEKNRALRQTRPVVRPASFTESVPRSSASPYRYQRTVTTPQSPELLAGYHMRHSPSPSKAPRVSAVIYDVDYQEDLEQSRNRRERGKERGSDRNPADKTKDSDGSLWAEGDSLFLLVLLYTLQGVPLGICLGSVPFLLQGEPNSWTFSQMGTFSLAAYPYSLKLFWSPIVDSFYWEGLGRRKSWIIPIQILVGLMMISQSFNIEESMARQDVFWVTAQFFLLVFLVATQDIAVDGWAVTMLSPPNRKYGSTCQAIGQNIGFFASYTIFLAFYSKDFCNTYIRSEPGEAGMISLAGYMQFWGATFILVTLLLFLKSEPKDLEEEATVGQVYHQIYQVVKLPTVFKLIFILVTCRVAFSTADNITVLKLTQKGFPKENMAILATLQFPFELIFPLIVGRLMSRGRILDPWLLGYMPRVLLSLVSCFVVMSFVGPESITTTYYFGILLLQLCFSFASNLMFVSQCAFFAHIADPAIGGTYMTLLNTVANLGNQWPKFIVFKLVDWLSCSEEDTYCLPFIPVGTDGYYVMCFVGAALGVTWYMSFKGMVNGIQMADAKNWRVNKEVKRSLQLREIKRTQ